MSNLNDYQKGLIDSSLQDIKDITSNDYSLSKLNAALDNLKSELRILPDFKDYALKQIAGIIQVFPAREKRFYVKFHQMNPRFLEVVLNLHNFKA